MGTILFSHYQYFSDYKAGFGGKYGVQNDRQDKSAVGWDHQEALQKHESQKGNNWKKTVTLDSIWFCNENS